MDDECRRVVEEVLRGDNGMRVAGVVEGRLWVSCVSCPNKALLNNDKAVRDCKTRVRVETGGFVLTVCGGCEEADRERLGAGQTWGIRIQRENIAASRGYRAIERWCGEQGWVRPAIRTERVLDRRALLREQVEGTRVRSIKVTERGGKDWVEILDYVEAGFLG